MSLKVTHTRWFSKLSGGTEGSLYSLKLPLASGSFHKETGLQTIP